MKVIERYRCELCNTEYSDKKKAEECEKNHKKPKKIVSYRHLAIGQNLKGYPVSVDVLMDDGNTVTFKR